MGRLVMDIDADSHRARWVRLIRKLGPMPDALAVALDLLAESGLEAPRVSYAIELPDGRRFSPGYGDFCKARGKLYAHRSSAQKRIEGEIVRLRKYGSRDRVYTAAALCEWESAAVVPLLEIPLRGVGRP